MRIDQVIEKLEEIKLEHGNLRVCVNDSHDYWGELSTEVEKHNLRVEHAAYRGPKNEGELAVVFDYSF